MSKAEFTGGEWKLAMGKTYCSIRTDDKVITDMRTVNGVFSLDDAHLIAAAPEMYKTLEEIKGVLNLKQMQTYNDINELLAKARGEL